MNPAMTQPVNAILGISAAVGLVFLPVAASAMPGPTMVRICSSAGIFYLPLEDDGQERQNDAGIHACHALCHGQKRHLKSRFLPRRALP